MSNFVKRISVYLVAALISVGATYGTYKYLEKSKPYSVADTTYNYGSKFNQDNVTLASYDADTYPDFTQAAEGAVHAVVHIKSTTVREAQSQYGQIPSNPFFEYFFGPQEGGRYQQPQIREGSGSGVIISEDGYIITNNHVIDKASILEVTLNDNRKFNAKVIGTDPDTDIALVKIEGEGFPYIPFGNSDELKVGEWVLAVGNPFNLTSTVTKGIVSAKARSGVGGGGIQSFIQTDAAINPGNSGGALVNTKGQLVGINTAIYSQTGNFAGYGFAVPISIAGKVVADIKEFGAVQRAMLGIQILDINKVKELDPEMTRDKGEKAELEKMQSLSKDIKLNNGVFVGGFADQSPAKQAGVTEGDIIEAVNGVKTPNVSILQEQVNKYRPGDKVKLEVDRYGKKMSFDIVLKNNEGTTAVIKKEDGETMSGVIFNELSREKKESYEINYGVEVATVSKGGVFAKAGIREGYIILEMNNTPIRSVDEAKRTIDKVSNSKDKVMFVKMLTPAGRTEHKIIDFTK